MNGSNPLSEGDLAWLAAPSAFVRTRSPRRNNMARAPDSRREFLQKCSASSKNWTSSIRQGTLVCTYAASRPWSLAHHLPACSSGDVGEASRAQACHTRKEPRGLAAHGPRSLVKVSRSVSRTTDNSKHAAERIHVQYIVPQYRANGHPPVRLTARSDNASVMYCFPLLVRPAGPTRSML